ncbi:MAG: hypothetical protein QOK37_3200 [Thermoanaerobaculia bacterium]|jgi:hypothetical protein|nr:hypothetical protein [Thermoanaerobaculia bacterium]
MTIRGLSKEVSGKLLRLSRERGCSVNALVVQILSDAVGVARRERLARYATWTPEELAQFEEAVSAQRVIDDSLWR